jgi:hypothetical protein
MKALARLLLPVFLLLVSAATWAEPVTVQHMRVWRAPDHTRIASWWTWTMRAWKNR